MTLAFQRKVSRDDSGNQSSPKASRRFINFIKDFAQDSPLEGQGRIAGRFEAGKEKKYYINEEGQCPQQKRKKRGKKQGHGSPMRREINDDAAASTYLVGQREQDLHATRRMFGMDGGDSGRGRKEAYD